jgi:hypothetical protein
MSTTNPSDKGSSERLARYRAMAESARREAARAVGEARESYLFIADQWDRLAEMATKQTTPPSSNFG